MFEVVWLQEALDELTLAWLNAEPTLRQHITQASHAIDRTLAADPIGTGESREDDTRVYFSTPLGVLFSVEAERRRVWVVHVWLYFKRGA